MSRRAQTALVAATLVLGACAASDTPSPADFKFTVIEAEPEPAPTPVPTRTASRATEREPEPVPAPAAVAPPALKPAVAMDTRTAAIDRLVRALDAPDPLLRANAIEGLHPVPDYAAVAVRSGLADSNRGVRYVAVVTVGKLRLDALAHLVRPLLDDPSQSVRAGAIYALRRNGQEVNPTPLAAMLDSQDPEVKANAAVILGEMGDRSAVPMLEQAMGRGLERSSVARARIVDMQIAEALVKLGSEQHIEGIRAALFAPAEQGELTALACQISGRLRDERVAPTLANLAHRPPPSQAPAEVRMVAIQALAEITPGRVTAEVPLEYVDHESPILRAHAVLTLGTVGDPQTLPRVLALMDDPDPLVQVSAAAAFLQLDRNRDIAHFRP